MNTKKTSRLIKRAEKLYDEEKYQEAIDLLLDKPSKKDKQNPDYWLWLGWCYYNENFEDNKQYKKVVDIINSVIGEDASAVTEEVDKLFDKLINEEKG